ncbi:MAG TPA: hypothetical protein DCE41_10440 [Cytophagales bacterium]|nr:hypothetical protein [Cytophagales bacterium]HAP61292.1 hypothetical protein [Cytophagales bacterium]
MKKVLFILLGVFGTLVLVILLLIRVHVFWLQAPYYEVERVIPLPEPIMDMTAYEAIWDTHQRPYIYSIESPTGGEVVVLGIDHTKDPNSPQLDSIRERWTQLGPDVALVEGRVGNLFSWLQDPVEELGEGGMVTSLAHRAGVPLYSWEPPKTWEIERLLTQFDKEQLVMFYSFRPYFSNMRYGKPESPEAQLQEYLDSRTDNDYLRGVFTSWEELDAQWQRDFPDLQWRDHDSGTGYPEGYLHDIWNASNLTRDEYMILVINELVGQGQKVIVTMGASHAPRIEACLAVMLTE